MKAEGVMLLIRSNTGFFNNHRGITVRLIIQFGQFSNLSEAFALSYLPANFTNIRPKLIRLFCLQTFSHRDPLGPLGCHSHQSSQAISIKCICDQCCTKGMLQLRFGWGQPADCTDMTARKCWRTNDGCYHPISSQRAFGSGELKSFVWWWFYKWHVFLRDINYLQNIPFLARTHRFNLLIHFFN